MNGLYIYFTVHTNCDSIGRKLPRFNAAFFGGGCTKIWPKTMPDTHPLPAKCPGAEWKTQHRAADFLTEHLTIKTVQFKPWCVNMFPLKIRHMARIDESFHWQNARQISNRKSVARSELPDPPLFGRRLLTPQRFAPGKEGGRTCLWSATPIVGWNGFGTVKFGYYGYPWVSPLKNHPSGGQSILDRDPGHSWTFGNSTFLLDLMSQNQGSRLQNLCKLILLYILLAD